MNMRLCVHLALFPILLCGATVLAQAPLGDPAELAKWRKTVEAGIAAMEANLAVAEQGLIVLNSLEGYRTVGDKRYYVFPSAAAKQRRIDAIQATLASERAKLAAAPGGEPAKPMVKVAAVPQLNMANLEIGSKGKIPARHRATVLQVIDADNMLIVVARPGFSMTIWVEGDTTGMDGKRLLGSYSAPLAVRQCGLLESHSRG